ncbi:MAG: MotA/TolQ/ExbB proton channel family protein [Planctomycetes bacterium]|nr:MotA/TolQ/ExbB proton channel family protein [Planctomycetota bacterium]
MRHLRFPGTKSWAWAVLVVLILNVALCGVLMAQDAGGGEQKQTEKKYTFFDVWILGGGTFFGFLLLAPIELLSIATVAATIEHFVTIQRDKLVPPEVVVELETLLDEEQYEEALNLCESSKNYITNIVGAAIARVGEGYEPMVTAAEGATEEENLKLGQKISWLSLFGNLGPMMGLFGTVVGMVMTFQTIAESTGSPSPADLAGGIFSALVTTVWGLMVAMPALAFFFVFKMKVQRLTFELSGVAMEIIERFKPVQEGK